MEWKRNNYASALNGNNKDWIIRSFSIRRMHLCVWSSVKSTFMPVQAASLKEGRELSQMFETGIICNQSPRASPAMRRDDAVQLTYLCCQEQHREAYTTPCLCLPYFLDGAYALQQICDTCICTETLLKRGTKGLGRKRTVAALFAFGRRGIQRSHPLPPLPSPCLSSGQRGIWCSHSLPAPWPKLRRC